MAEKKILTIDRTKWRRGGPGEQDAEAKAKGSYEAHTYALNRRFGQTMLLNNKGLMCCLGFDALACGLAPEDIENVGEPSDIPRPRFGFVLDEDDYEYIEPPSPSAFKHREYFISRVDGNAQAIGDAINFNDGEGFKNESEREARVREVLLKLGWDDVVFVN